MKVEIDANGKLIPLRTDEELTAAAVVATKRRVLEKLIKRASVGRAR